MWPLYELTLILGLLWYLPGALWRRRLPHRGWSMRLGRYPAALNERLRQGRPCWVHAVSVGEVLAARPLLQELARAYPTIPLVLSTVTSSGFEVASKQVSGRGSAIYFPLDLRPCVRRALEAVRPRILLLVEAELWPVMIHEAHVRRLPIAVVNGRVSRRSFGRYLLVRRLFMDMLRRVDLFLMQSPVDADRVIQLGAPPERVRVVGNLKWDASLGARPSPEALQDVAARLGLTAQDVTLVGGSTHRGEEEGLLRAFQALRATHPRMRLILAPRHLERLAEVEGVVRRAGFSPVRLSSLGASCAWEVGVVDTFGQLPLYYGVATVVFIGGSLVAHGGQNPLEAASLGRPILFGPSMENFGTIAHELLAHHAARQVASVHELTQLLEELCARRADAHDLGRRAQELTERFRGAAQRTLDMLRGLLPEP